MLDQADCDLLVVTTAEAVAVHPQRRLFLRCGFMNYQAFTNDSLIMMYEGVRGALAADDALEGSGKEIKFRVRATTEWKKHAADLEMEMLRRGMTFDLIDWTEPQGSLPFDP
jgi:hypothetical protein